MLEKTKSKSTESEYPLLTNGIVYHQVKKQRQNDNKNLIYINFLPLRERSGSVVERLTRDRRVAGSSLTGVTALCP